MTLENLDVHFTTDFYPYRDGSSIYYRDGYIIDEKSDKVYLIIRYYKDEDGEYIATQISYRRKTNIELEFKELRAATGMSLKQYSEYFNIPYRTVQNWEGGQRKCSTYLLELMKYKLEKENILK